MKFNKKFIVIGGAIAFVVFGIAEVNRQGKNIRT